MEKLSNIMDQMQNEDLDTIKEMLDKNLAIYDIETENTNMFDKNSFQQLFFQRLDQVSNTVKVITKNNFLMPKHVVYYLYKSRGITKDRRDFLVKELHSILKIDDADILTSLIKMKDQDLAE